MRVFGAVFGMPEKIPKIGDVENYQHFCDFWQVCFFEQKSNFGTPIFIGFDLGKQAFKINVPNQKSWQVCQTCQKIFFGTGISNAD